MYKRNVALNRNIVQVEYIQLYQKILVQLQKRNVYKQDLLDNLHTIKDDSKSSIITQLKNYGKEISVNLGENLIYSEDNFDFKIPSNKNMTIALRTEYEQNKELINCLNENKLSEKYSELDNKLLTYITATSISSKDSLNTSSDQISYLNYEDKEVEKVKQQVKEIEENKLENFYIFLMVVLVTAISYLIFISISKRYFTTDLRDINL